METVLSSLTHETLKELGVTAVGHRLKLLDAIAARLQGIAEPNTVVIAEATRRLLGPRSQPPTSMAVPRFASRCMIPQP
jgi:hypothetical protein